MLGACSINKVILMGRLTSDPELRQTPSGVPNCRFTVAVTRGFANQNGERQSDFITVVAWRQTAEFLCRNFSKGRLILVEGELRTSTYDDKRYPDVRHYVTEVYADNVSFGETRASASGGYQSGNYQQGYNNNQSNGYGAQGGYSQSAPQQGGYSQNNGYSQSNSYSQSNNYQQPAPSVSVGDLSDFEEVISDSDLPF